MPSRRRFIAQLALLAAASGLPRRSWGAVQQWPTEYPVQPVPGGGLVFLGEGGAVLALPTREAPLIIDAKFAPTADDLARQVARKVRAMPELLINTHHHLDHTGGNWVFSPTAEVIAHKQVRPRLEANLPIYRDQAAKAVQELRARDASPQVIQMAVDAAANLDRATLDAFAAKREFESTLELTHGGVRIVLHHFGAGHTDNDAVVCFPTLNLLHVGDLVFNRWHPYIDRSAGATTIGWQRSLREAMKLCDEQTTVIAGHGRVDTRAALARQIEYFDIVRGLVGKAIKAGQTRGQVAALDDQAFAAFEDVRLKPMAMQAVFDELAETGAAGPAL